MSKRRIIGLVIMSLLAIVSVAGLVFAFNNSNKNLDVFANMTTSVDNETVDLEIEVDEDPEADNGLTLVDNDARVGYFTITVGGLPNYLPDSAIDLAYNSKVEGGIADIELVESKTGKGKGMWRFRVTGKNSGEARVVFTTIPGGREITVTIKVNLTPKYVNLAKKAHFGVMQGGTLDLNSGDARAKLTFYAHEKDVNQIYRPNGFSQLYFELKKQYQGITLQDGILSVDSSVAAGQEIFALVWVAGMTTPVEVPIYIFEPMGEITVSSPTAFQPESTGVDYYDLILNRTDMDRAVFDFAVTDYGTVGEDYGFVVQSQNASMVSVNDGGNAGSRTFMASRNLGETIVKVTAYPIAVMTVDGVPGQSIEFKDATDRNVQTTREINIRVRNEFISSEESTYEGQLRFSKTEINAFYYEGTQNNYTDNFTIETAKNLSINYDNDVEFELVVEDDNGILSGIFTKDGYYEPDRLSLKKDKNNAVQNYTVNDVLDIRLLNDAGEWVQIASVGNRAHYRSQFSIALIKRTAIIKSLLTDNITLYLRVKSVAKLSTSTATENKYAICDVPLVGSMAIDDFSFQGLSDAGEIALVYNRGLANSPVTIDVYGIVRDSKTNTVTTTKDWNADKVTANLNELSPFEVTPSNNYPEGKITYTFAIKASAEFAYYQAYPFTLTYPNGVTRTVNVKVFPYASTVKMNMVSDNDGIVYKTIKVKDNHDEYEYLQTVYVRMGANYRISVDTPGVSVDAKTDLDFTARSEGTYTNIPVRLSACNDDVFQNHDLEFTINIVVVNPIRNVTLSEDKVTLPGIGKGTHIDFDIQMIKDTDNPYENLYIEQTIENDNVSVKDLSVDGFYLEANYLTEAPVVVGFRIYKVYSFSDDTLEMPYIKGLPIEVTINIKNTNSVKEIKPYGDAIDEKTNVGRYVSVVSNTNTNTILNVNMIPDNASNTAAGLAFAKWQDGKYNLDLNLQIDDILTVSMQQTTVPKTITIMPKANVTSMGEYALVIYALDSMRLVNGVALPDLYTVLPLYVGTADKIEETIKDISSVVHDANSGVRNTLGGFNWIIPGVDAQNGSTHSAALFYTAKKEGASEESSGGSKIKANRYYLDDLRTVLGWDALIDDIYDPDKKIDKVFGGSLDKYINGENVGTIPLVSDTDNRKRRYFEIDEASQDGWEVKYVLHNGSTDHNMIMEFYSVKGIDRYEVWVTGMTGLAARKNLSPDGTDKTEFENTISVQRCEHFEFDTTTSSLSIWETDLPDTSDSGKLSYEGGQYEFIPYVKFNGLRFAVTGLKATVRIEVYGGVDYLSIAQRSTTINGAVGAIYDVTLKIDRKWDVSLLDYWFVYNGVAYPLFNDTVSSKPATYVAMEGGNAGFYWQLTCLNPDLKLETGNSYYTYYLRLDVSVIIGATARDPFRDINNAQLILRENFGDFPLQQEPATKTASLNVKTQNVTNITFKHFANTVTDKNTGDLSVPANQTDTTNIYVDSNIAGGVLKVYPTPYYISVDSIELASSFEVVEYPIGVTLRGDEITDKVRYSIGFTQLIYNRETQTYQTFLSGNSYRMVSSWSAKDGYQWDGVYYFKTFLQYDGQLVKPLADGTTFEISVAIKSDGREIKSSMTLYAHYKDGITVTPENNGTAVAVSTMTQNRYQALGTTAIYDIALPTGYVATYNAYSIHGNGAAYVNVAIDTNAKTLQVELAGNPAAINSQIEIRFPYKAQGDFANPYLSVVIIPVYYEITGFEFYNHPENPLQILYSTNAENLRLRAVAKYNTNLNVDMAAKLADFNTALSISELINRYNDGVSELTINLTYSYVNGLPVIVENGDIMYERVFKYEIINAQSDDVLSRTVNQAIGLTKEYDLDIPNKANLSRVAKVDANGKTDTSDAWDVWLTSDGKIDVRLNYDTTLIKKILIVHVYSRYDNINPEFILQIQPSYFTFDGFKLKNYPLNPLVALSKPFVVTLEADNVEYCQDDNSVAEGIREKIRTFNQTLAKTDALHFSRLVGDVLNFNFDNYTHELSRIGDVNAISYLKAVANVAYADGVPTLNSNGATVTTVFTVKTYGSSTGTTDPNDPNSPTAAPSSRTMKAAQAIGTTRSYNIALANVNYDATLDKNELTGAKVQAWSSASQWDAVLRGNEVVVTLADKEALFGKILQILVYSQEDSSVPAYIIYISPAWFTVESIQVVGHPEKPLVIDPENLDELELDFVADYNPGFDSEAMTAKMDEFRNELNTSLSVLRVTDNGVLSLIAGLTFVNGQPTFTSINANDAVVVRSNYAYKTLAEAGGLLTRTEAQVIGEKVAYTLDFGRGKRIDGIKPLQDTGAITDWSVETDNNKTLWVKLNNTPNLIGKKLKVEVFSGSNEEPSFTLNIIPAYFVIEDLTVAGQSGQDVWIITPDTPDTVALAAVARGNTNLASVDNPLISALDTFNDELNSSVVTRIYDQDSLSGNLYVIANVRYVNGLPTIVAEAPDDASVITFNTLFTYTIYAEGQYRPSYPDVPTTPRTRTAVQAIGTQARYKIDLGKDVAIFADDDNQKVILQGANYEAHWEGDEVVVSLSSDLRLFTDDGTTTGSLQQIKEIKLNLYSLLDKKTPIFVLTIKPVLFEVIGFEVIGHPENPVRLSSTGSGIDALRYRAVARYDHSLENTVQPKLIEFNNYLGTVVGNNTRVFQYETDGQYLTIRAGVNYLNGDLPTLCVIANNPTKVVETTLAYQVDGPITNTATYNQAVGTTEYYTIDTITNPEDYVANGTPNCTATLVGNKLQVTLGDNGEDLVQSVAIVQIQDRYNGNTLLTVQITPVWFVVEGFEVVNHPERHLWLIVPEKVADLKFSVKARSALTTTADTALKNRVAQEIKAFNTGLQNEYNAYLVRETSGGEYLTVSGAIEYLDGMSTVVNMASAASTKVVKSTFQYKMYNNSGNNIVSNGIIYPTEPRTLTQAQAFGLTKKYHIDLPDLTAYSTANARIWEETLDEDGNKVLTRWTNFATNGWDVSIANNYIEIQLSTNPDLLIGKRLKVYIYYSADNPNPAFVLNVDPVWFTVTDLAVKGHPEQPFVIIPSNGEDADKAVVDFAKDLSFMAVAEYSPVVTGIAQKIADFNDELNWSNAKLNLSYIGPFDDTYYLTAATSVSYVPYTANWSLTDEYVDRIWHTFAAVIADNDQGKQQAVEQAIGTQKTYTIDIADSLTNKTYNGINWKAEVIDHEVTVTLDAESSLIGKEIKINLDNGKFTLLVTPVYFEVLGLEVVEHPERPMWLYLNDSTGDLVYRVRTNEIPSGLDIQAKIDDFNRDLNASRNTMLSETLSENKYLTVRVAVDYQDGLPVIVPMTTDLRNVVEEIIEYYVWADTTHPTPEYPPVMGTSGVLNQVLGSSKSYNLSNVAGKVYYQYLWVEGAGNNLTNDSLLTKFYEGAAVSFDAVKNKITVQLAANTDYLGNTIKVYLPYLVNINGAAVWYSYCIEINPVLFEVYGLGITSTNNEFEKQVGNYIQLKNDGAPYDYPIEITVYENHSNDAGLQEAISKALATFMKTIQDNANLIRWQIGYDTDRNINLFLDKDDKFVLRQESVRDLVNSLFLSTNIKYEQGIPTAVVNDGTQITSEIMIYTGAVSEPWPPHMASMGNSTQLQVIGTTYTYDVQIPFATEILYDEIDFNRITINDLDDGVDDLVQVTSSKTDATITVTLAPNTTLLSREIEIIIPFKLQEVKYCYLYKIRPVLYRVEGFTLTQYPSNNVNLGNDDIAITLSVKETRSTNANIRNAINLAIDALENEINQFVRNNGVDWEIERPSLDADPNMQLVQQAGQLLLRKFGNVTATGKLIGELTIGYEYGMPVLNTGALQTTLPIQIVVNTVEEVNPFFPGLDNISMGDNSYSSYYQAIGTSKSYNLTTTNANQVFYFDNLIAKNAGPLRGPRQYEHLDIQWTGDHTAGSVIVTLKADAGLFTNPIEICIPYTEIIDGALQWRYYSLSVQPVLFEIVGWGVEQEGNIVNQITLNSHAIELNFRAKIVSASLVQGTDEQIFSDADLRFIQSAIDYVNEQLNQYDTSISNNYRYLFIHNSPEEGHQVNYLIYRDYDAQKNYIVRDVDETATTIMQISTNVSYETDGNRAVGASHPTIGYGQIVYDTVEIITGDVSFGNETVITQENAYLLSQLSANTNYIIMSDIYLSQVYEGGWTPSAVPENTTLDGNNYRIFLDGVGFDLSGAPTNIGLFSTVASGAVLKNVQVVLPAQSADNMNRANVLQVDLDDYNGGDINIGVLAGINNGVITNCAVLSEWQFMQNTYGVTNPITNEAFRANLKFNADGYLFDDTYYYQTDIVDGELKVVKVFDNYGYRLVKNKSNNWVRDMDAYGISRERLNLIDKTNVAKYDNYSAMMVNGEATGKLFVTNTNKSMSVVLGGLVGTNNHMVTNSRVLIDVELDGPQTSTVAGETEEITATSAIVGGFLGSNNGTVTTSFFRDGNVINNANVGSVESGVTGYLGGFVGFNQRAGIIQQSYAMGKSTGREGNTNYVSSAGSVKTIRNLLGGFVHQNAGTIKDCQVNMVIDKEGAGLASGFVYQNLSNATITNCIENNKVLPAKGGSYAFFLPFIVMNDNMVAPNSTVSYANLTNIIYAGEREFPNVFGLKPDGSGILVRLTDTAVLSVEKYSKITNYNGFSIGEGDGDNDWGISANNTIWQMTNMGPRLRAANEIAVSFRKYRYSDSVYLFNPGTARNPYLIWNQDLFRKYVYSATPNATVADQEKTKQDVERNRQSNHLRMVDNITLNTIPDTYKITYTGTFEGNGLTMDGINLPSVAGEFTTIGLFGKLEYATIRNIKFGLSSVGINAYRMRYVGGLAGISINTNYVDVVMDGSSSTTVIGANIVGGIAGLAVITNPWVENYNITSNVSVSARHNNGYAAPGDSMFSSGMGYYQQTLYAINKNNIEQAYSTAGGVFGFVTSNPNNYRINYDNGTYEIVARSYDGNRNQDATFFMKDELGNPIDDEGVYYNGVIVLRNVGGAVKNITASVAGGLVGIMDETIELRDSKLTSLSSLVGKYYLGGLVGINLGKISGGSVNINSFNVKSIVTTNSYSNYIFSASESPVNPGRYWGMTIGAVAAYNDGFSNNHNSGLIENLNVNVNMLVGDSRYIYVIGGVVGVNGDNGYIDSVVNQRYSAQSNSNILLTSSTNVGFYFGNIVGRGNVKVDVSTGIQSFTTFDKTRMDLVRVPLTEYVNAENFQTPYLEPNTFGVQANVTRKVQTLTMQEYKDYMVLQSIRNSKIVDRVKLLEYWFRSLPTVISPRTINGEYVAVEEVKSSYLLEFFKWIEDNHIFKYTYSGVDYEQAIMKDYRNYVTYSAIGTNVAWLSQLMNLENARQARYDQAIEFFTYKSHISGGASGVHNLNFTWEQYEDYCYVRDHALSSDTDYDNYLAAQRTGKLVIGWTNPYQEFVEYYVKQDVMGIGWGADRTISNNAAFIALKDGLKDDAQAQFTANDPLQGYINYLIPHKIGENANHEVMFERANGWTMSLAQYYYFVNNIMPNSYGLDDQHQYQYTAEEYADYLYTNYRMRATAGRSMTLDEYIDFARNERDKILAYEKEWVIQGHTVNGALVGEAGGVTMGWNRSGSWGKQEQGSVRSDSTTVYMEVGGQRDESRVWDVVEQYTDAKDYQGLTFAFYEEMRNLGGNLYTLRKDFATAQEYVFYLKVPQYAWEPKQASFIQKAFGLDGIKYAIAATYYGDVLSYSMKNARAIKVGGTTGDNTFDDYDNWFIDSNSKPTDKVGVWDTGELKGDYQFGTGEKYILLDKDGKAKRYEPLRYIDLRANDEQGAALYLDENGDKIFSFYKKKLSESGGLVNQTDANGDYIPQDVLLMYEVATAEDADFKELDSGKYYAISRHINERSRQRLNYVDGTSGEQTDNHSDYLEEAVWWKQEGFTAEQFSSIKHHAMHEIILPADSDGALSPQVKVTFDDNGAPTASRELGFVLADDWNCYDPYTRGQKGFKGESGNFTTADYTDIVLGNKFNGLGNWNSKFGEYKLFERLYKAGLTGAEQTLTVSSLAEFMPNRDTSNIDNPFRSEDFAKEFVGHLVPEKILSDAIEFAGSDKLGYVTMAKAGGTLVDFVKWAEQNQVAANGENYNYRLNHYIYVRLHKLTKNDLPDFNWALQEVGIRDQIWYSGATAEAKTTDLMEFRQEWYNDGNSYMTFRDYCEWINVYKYGEDYKVARGDLAGESENENINIKNNPNSGWLTIYSYAVWKRMEKYENNVVYLQKAGDASGVVNITAPIYKRQISTTVFPKIYSSGNAAYYGKTPTLPSNISTNDNLANNYYGWTKYKVKPTDCDWYVVDPNDPDNHNIKIDKLETANRVYGDLRIEGYDVNKADGRQRHWLDRYEYNEKYEVMTLGKNFMGTEFYTARGENNRGQRTSVEHTYKVTDWDEVGDDVVLGILTLGIYNIYQAANGKNYKITEYSYDENRSMAEWYYKLMPETDLTQACDDKCGGNRDGLEKFDSTSTYTVGICTNPKHARYQIQKWESRYGSYVTPSADKTYLILDEYTKTTDQNGKEIENGVPTGQYAQLYIPYEYFEKACQRIMQVYSADNNYLGYHNYMKYWAKNGSANWICDTSEFYNIDPTMDDPDGYRAYEIVASDDGTGKTYYQVKATNIKYQKVKYPYTSKSFWENFTKNPHTGQDGTPTRNPLGNDDGHIVWSESKKEQPA